MAEWTEGIANREYGRGTRVEAPFTEELRGYLDRQAELYLADASKFRLTPSADRCLSVIYTANDKQTEHVVETYRRLTRATARG